MKTGPHRTATKRRFAWAPVKGANGYRVEIELAADDTYTVRRVFKRGAKTFDKGTMTGVYAEDIGEVAYYASCFRNVDFPLVGVTL